MNKVNAVDKRILVFYPHNFFEMSSGTHSRFDGLARYLKARGFAIDLVSLNGFTNQWDEESLAKGTALFDSIHIVKWQPLLKWYDFIKKIRGRLVDLTNPALRAAWRHALAIRQYDFVIVSYVYYEKLVDAVGEKIPKVIDLHDFVTLSEHLASRNRVFTFGRMFEKEINSINRFDYALSISEEETVMLAPFCPHTRFVDVPAAFPESFQGEGDFSSDILFIGSDNVFNREGMAWFMERVYPLLAADIRIVVAGKITGSVAPRPNITTIPYAADLGELYSNSKVIICPLKSGTGLKVKVVEALSYGRPVVTTRWGVTGMLKKFGNGCVVADDEQNFAAAINRLISDDKFYRTVRDEGIAYFQERFSADSCWKKLDEVFVADGGTGAQDRV